MMFTTDQHAMTVDHRMLDKLISELMKSAGLPGLTVFAIQQGSEYSDVFGIQSVETNRPVDAQTVFEAASLSKPVVAYAALQLMDAGTLDLDVPLSHIIGPLVPDDVASAAITPRHVLSHTTGLPNWRRNEFPLRTYFLPGSRFSYSGEGFVYLQSAIEHLTGEPLDALIKQLVFDPLGMNTSSFLWQDSFSENAAIGHGSDGTVEPKFKPGKANAAFSLHTTASDYGRFVLSAMDGALLEEGTAQLWMETQVPTPHDRFEDLGRPPTDTDFNVTWGLGWGIEPDSNSFFHWGANPGATAFVLGVPKERTAVVVFINSDAGLKFVPSIINHISPGPHPALTWLGLPDVK